MTTVSKSFDDNIYVILPDKTICLTEDEESLDVQLELSTFTFFSSNTVLLFFPKKTQDMLRYMKSALTSQKLLRNIADKKLCGVSIALKREPNTGGQIFSRGMAFYLCNEENAESLATIKSTAKLRGFDDYCQVSVKNNHLIARTYCMQTSDLIREQKMTLLESGRGISTSPIFENEDLCPVFHEYSKARAVLEQFLQTSRTDNSEVKELLSIYDRLVPERFDVETMRAGMKYPFVVVEGLDATGKTTLTETLERKLKAARYYTPPGHIGHLRKHFDSLPEQIRRAYYCLGNYIVAMEISKECQERPVIMDRFWHSTAAYGITNESSDSDLPAVGHRVYKWPKDLLQPTLILFLTVSEEIRKERISNRNEEKTVEEKKLDKDTLYRQRLCEAYRRMHNPASIEIDASGSKESVVKEAIQALQRHSIYLDWAP